MKTFLFVATLCLLPFQSVAAEEMMWGGKTYRVETIRPVQVDALGRIMSMPPMTILVPIKATTGRAQEANRMPLPTTIRRTANEPTHQTPAHRVANREFAASDISRSLLQPPASAPVSPRSDTRSFESSRQLVSGHQRTSSNDLRDSRTLHRRVY